MTQNLPNEIDKYFSESRYFKSAWNELGDATMHLSIAAQYFYNLALQDIREFVLEEMRCHDSAEAFVYNKTRVHDEMLKAFAHEDRKVIRQIDSMVDKIK